MRLLLVLAWIGCAAASEKIAIYLDPAAGEPPANAVRLLERGLRARGVDCRRVVRREDRNAGELLIALDRDILGGGPESFAIARQPRAGIRVAGSDDTGLMYGVFELLGQVESEPRATSVLAAARDTSRSPERRVRSVNIFPQNSDLEDAWMYSEEFWNSYFETLARSRFNYFLLSFGHQTAYFSPLFPFLMETPGFERIRVPSLTPERRERNLKMLQTASSLAERWGIKFVLGIWQQHAIKIARGKNMVEGITYENLFDYNPKALSQLLRLCPKIQGLQFRMNSESGIEEDDQERFYRKMLEAARSAGRPLYLDLRAKGLRQETIDAAGSLGFEVTTSTKYWREHFGLPYHSTVINPWDAKNYRRYGYWDLLRQDRNYNVLYEAWTGGSLKVMLWGGLDYARRFAESTAFGNGTGFEVFAPLSQKGFLNWRGGDWRIFADRKSEYYRWESERYWAFYMAFGLAGYGGATPVFEAEFRNRFGAAAAAMREAYSEASWVIPSVTAMHQPASSWFRYWPEMDTGGLTDVYIGVPTGDDGRFYPIFEYVDDVLAGKLSGRVTPVAMAERLDGIADRTAAALARAGSSIAGTSREFAATRIDLLAQAALARYHAARLRSGTDYQFFRKTGERFHLLAAIREAQSALQQWKQIVGLTAGHYYGQMVFNDPPDQIGHWADLLPSLERDVARLREIDALFVRYSRRPADARALNVKRPWFFMPMQWKEEGGVLSRWFGPDEATAPVEYPATEARAAIRTKMQDPSAAIRELLDPVGDGAVAHVPRRFGRAGEVSPIHASVLGMDAGAPVRLRYRMGGSEFASIDMRQSEEQVYTAALPAAAAGQKVEYYIEAGDNRKQKPHTLQVCAASPQPPVIGNEATWQWRAGRELRIKATLTGDTAAVVRLHYRRVNQALDWSVAPMRSLGGGAYDGVIPGSAIASGWDLMYTIEAVSECGEGVFHPDYRSEQPFVVVKVQ